MCTIRKLFSPFIQKRDYMSESVWADSSGCPERTLRPQNSHCHSRRNVLSHVGGMWRNVAEWCAGSLPSSSSPSSSASAPPSRPEELKGPHFARTHECFVVVEPHVQKIWKERGFLKNPEIKSTANAAHFFSVCFARSTAYVTLWNIMLQMPINQIQRIARKEAGEEDGGRASCAAAVHNNTQLLAQIEELWWVFFFFLSVFSAGAGVGWCGSRAGELHAWTLDGGIDLLASCLWL